MTAALVARLVERGATDWEAPLPQLLGDLGDFIHPAWDEITLSQLLLHRAGLPPNMTRRDLIAAQTDPRPVTEQRRAAAASALARHPRRPGRFRYSNLGYVVAGTAIERLTGRSYEDALGHELLGVGRRSVDPSTATG
jgi:D-alanyl-D-alanine carboxypeptidase